MSRNAERLVIVLTVAGLIPVLLTAARSGGTASSLGHGTRQTHAERLQSPGGAVLSLTSVFTYEVPDSLELAGLAVATRGDVAAWASNSSDVLIFSARGVTRVRDSLFKRPIAAAFDEARGVLEVVDADRRAVFDVTTDGQVSGHALITAPVNIAVAARTEDGWFVGGRPRTSEGRFEVFPAVGAGSPVYVSSLRRASTRLPPYLSAAGHKLFIGFTDEPREVVLILPRTREAATFQMVRAPTQISGRKALWRALPVFALDTVYVQTLADLTSNARLLVLYDRLGRIVRVRSVDAPMGLVATDAQTRLVVGARRIDHVEVVGYRWKWVRDQ